MIVLEQNRRKIDIHLSYYLFYFYFLLSDAQEGITKSEMVTQKRCMGLL